MSTHVIEPPRHESSTDPEDNPVGDQLPRILMIEDEPLTVKYVGKVLRQSGLDVTAPRSLAELRRLYDELDQYDVVTLDLALRQDGWGIHGSELLREMIARSSRPIYVIWTAYGSSPESRTCLAAGAELVLRKGASVESIAQFLRAVGQQHAACRQLVPRYEDL